MVEHVFGDLAEQWEFSKKGFKLDCEHGGGIETLLNMVWYADNVWFWAMSHDELSEMVRQATIKAHKHGLDWKPESLEVMYGEHVDKKERKKLTVKSLTGEKREFKVVEEIKALGSWFDEKGGTEVAFDKAKAMADRTYQKK